MEKKEGKFSKPTKQGTLSKLLQNKEIFQNLVTPFRIFAFLVIQPKINMHQMPQWYDENPDRGIESLYALLTESVNKSLTIGKTIS